MKEHKIKLTARYIKPNTYEVKGVIFKANDEIDAIRKYCRTKKPSEIEN